MRNYWIRMLGAYILLHIASRLVKDAEKTLKQAAVTHTQDEIIETTATPMEVTNG